MGHSLSISSDYEYPVEVRIHCLGSRYSTYLQQWNLQPGKEKHIKLSAGCHYNISVKAGEEIKYIKISMEAKEVSLTTTEIWVEGFQWEDVDLEVLWKILEGIKTILSIAEIIVKFIPANSS